MSTERRGQSLIVAQSGTGTGTDGTLDRLSESDAIQFPSRSNAFACARNEARSPVLPALAARFDNVVCCACCFRCFLLSEYLSPARRPAPPNPPSLPESLSPARRPAAAVLGRRIGHLQPMFLRWIRIS